MHTPIHTHAQLVTHTHMHTHTHAHTQTPHIPHKQTPHTQTHTRTQKHTHTHTHIYTPTHTPTQHAHNVCWRLVASAKFQEQSDVVWRFQNSLFICFSRFGTLTQTHFFSLHHPCSLALFLFLALSLSVSFALAPFFFSLCSEVPVLHEARRIE